MNYNFSKDSVEKNVYIKLCEKVLNSQVEIKYFSSVFSSTAQGVTLLEIIIRW